uniref:(+)-delta-cadinene synthase n=1 Tax=Gossypium raimondii TaxID=29730 RepID=A0A0D2R283_GOSRA|nr:hypothetical protein B456_002G080400 [Gossypium raimondii]
MEIIVSFIVFMDIDTTNQLRYEQLKEEVRRMLMAPMDTSIRKLPLIDAIQRLEAFYKFKDEEGNFKSSLTNDVQGLLELYEVSYMCVHGEDILDEAISFTTTHLTLAAATLDYPLSEQVTHALKQSIQKGLPRVEARRYIFIYQDIESHNNIVGLLHRKELSEICRWWKDLDFTRKLPFARDRVVEGYFWIMGVYFEPQYSLDRKMITKVIAMESIVDDTYDSYATYDELIPYTDAIESMKRLISSNNCWTHQNYKPTFEEFRDNALPTSSYAMLAITAFMGVGDVITPETFTWAAGDPKIIKASTIICRFTDDIAEHKFKHRREDDCSAIECYIEQYGVTAQEAYYGFNKHIENSWKEINKEFLKPTEIPIPVLNRSLNLARVRDVLYREGDGYIHVGKAPKGGITSLLIEPVPL